MTGRRSVATLLAIYIAAAISLALGQTVLTVVLLLAFLAVDKFGAKVAQSFRNASAFMSSARHAAAPSGRKDPK